MNFKQFCDTTDACSGYVLAALMTEVSAWLNEGRKDRDRLARQDFARTPALFDEPDPASKIDKFVGDEGDHCEVTPLSGYATHIGAIQQFAHASPQNFAQVLMFSPLSANVPFAKHWDNYQMLMAILKHQFPDRVTRQDIEQAVDAFGDKYHALAHTIAGFKLDTIADIWSNKAALFQELNKLANGGDDVALISRLSQIKGVQPVKAGFIAQLLWGRAGCIDTHNIDIYSKVFPDMDKAGDFNDRQWAQKGGVEKYVNTLDKLAKRGIGSQQLWDVWVDFVESMYIMITQHGKGYYDMQGPALDPTSPEYGAMAGVKIPKVGIGKDRGGVMVPLAAGKVGRGASATHLPMDPDEALKQFHAMYTQGQKGSAAARAVAFRTDARGNSLDQNLGTRPTALHYLGQAVGPHGVDPDMIRHIIAQRIAQGGKKARRTRAARQQGDLFA